MCDKERGNSQKEQNAETPTTIQLHRNGQSSWKGNGRKLGFLDYSPCHMMAQAREIAN